MKVSEHSLIWLLPGNILLTVALKSCGRLMCTLHLFSTTQFVWFVEESSDSLAQVDVGGAVVCHATELCAERLLSPRSRESMLRQLCQGQLGILGSIVHDEAISGEHSELTAKEEKVKKWPTLCTSPCPC